VTETVHTSGFGRRLVAFALFALCMFTALTLVSTSQAAIETPPPPQVWSDKADYAPGETVTLSGASWAAGESVHIRVNDDAGQTWSRDVDVTASADGTFTDQFNLSTSFVAFYSVTATGSTSGTATWSFTDGNVEYSIPRQPLSGLQNVNTGSSVSFTVGGKKQGGGDDPVVTGIETSGLGTSGATGCASGGTQIPTSWLSITSPALPQTLSSSTTFTNFTVRVSPPSGATGGTYTGQVKFTVSQGGAGSGFNLCLNVISDTTPPVITPTVTGTLGSNGWHTSNVSVSWTVTDPESTVTSTSGCGTSNVTSDTTGVTFTCTATSSGGTASNSVTIKRDATAPVITDLGPTPALPNGNNGWYTVDVSNKFKATDATSGLSASCVASFPLVSGDNVQSKTTSGEGSAVKVTSDSCSDQAGNTAASKDSAAFKIDKTAPTVTVTPARSPDHDGWYNAPVAFSAAASNNGPSGAGSCDAAETYSGPDDASASVSMDCSDGAGNVGTGSASFQYDATAPTGVAGAPARPADHNGWHNHAVTIQFSGNDATSGIDSCSSPSYDGPDGMGLTVNGSCTDNAGNTSDPVASSTFKFDKTNPFNVSGAPARSPDHNGWYNHAVTIQFSGNDATSGIDSCSSPSYNGPDGTGRTVNGSCTDNAGNTSAAVASSSFDYDATNPTLNPTVTPNPVVLNGSATASPGASDATSGVDAASCPAVPTNSVGSKSVTCTAIDNAGNSATANANYNVVYSTANCLGSSGHTILQPINVDGTSVFKQGSTVPAKFRVCDVNGNSIGTAGVVSEFKLVQTISGLESTSVNEAVDSTTPDTAFRWSATDQQWIFNVNTKKLTANKTYVYKISLNDGSWISFQFGLK
jgi:hypothetical protein